jgi:uncharacterized surface anchored protein
VQIIKIDADTKQPLKSVEFTIYKQNGEIVGAFETDGNGLIIVGLLPNGWYKAVETKSPDGYLQDDTPKDFELKGNQFIKLVFENKKISGLQIKKLDSVTRKPIKDVVFSVEKLNGERVGTYTTGKNGTVFVPELLPDHYVVTEIKAADGYQLDSSPKNITIKAGENAYLEVLNTPDSGLLIIKTDAQTGKPLKGVTFDIQRSDGQRVQGDILDKNLHGTPNNSPNKSTSANGAISGNYTTDVRGRIQINSLEAGEYLVTETKALPGYELDTEVYSITVEPGKQEVLRLENTPLAGLRILKVDAVTGQPIFNTEFMVFDENNKVVGTFYTDHQGIIDLSAILTEGRYTLRETGHPRDITAMTFRGPSNLSQGKSRRSDGKTNPKPDKSRFSRLHQMTTR